VIVHLQVRNESARKRLYRRDVLQRLTERVLAGEGVADAVEVSVLFCDDAMITELNRQYRGKNKPTDVLSFEQEAEQHGPRRLLGDIVISLETVERHCAGDRAAMVAEVRLLVCHGLLHLLGHDHATAAEQAAMNAKQAEYLGVDMVAAWRTEQQHRAAARRAVGGAGGEDR
jgi:probable rRNA maturation factor